MRIGEVAALVGLTPRAVRHYHHRGLLPEPKRLANGYRDYDLRDVVVLARIRRLTELGLTLDEIRDALGDTRDLHEILVDLDNDLAEQEARLRARRTRLAALIERTHPHPDDAVTPELLALLDDLADSSNPLAELERELIALLDVTATPADRDSTIAALRAHQPDPDRARDLTERLTALADAPTDDPRIPALAAEMAEALPPSLRDIRADPGRFGEAILDALTPAQAEVVRHVLRLLEAEAT